MMKDEVAHKVAQFCRKHRLLAPGEQVVVGVSGGPDSLCLLHLLHSFGDLTLTVAHLNHQLRGPDADADETFVQDIAAQWGLPCVAERQDVAVAKGRRSLEEAARQIRYDFLRRVAQQTGATTVAVGHHADDQVETVLMHFLRGAGPAGLRGMPPSSNLADLWEGAEALPAPQLIRPLLELSRAEIEAYCQRHRLTPRQDASNQDTTFFRNRLRYELLPYLETYNPNIRHILRRTAQIIAADTAFVEQQLAGVWPRLLCPSPPGRGAGGEGVFGAETHLEFDRRAWGDLPLALKRASLRRAITLLRRNLRNINFEHIEAALAVIEKGETGAQATLPQELLLTIGYERFTLAAGPPPPPDIPHLAGGQTLAAKLPGVTLLPGTAWQLSIELVATLSPVQVQAAGPWEAYLDAEVVGLSPILRTRRTGDTFAPLGLGGRRQKVTDFMINQKIPAGQRDRVPLLASADDRLLWVCGYRLDERAALRPTTRQLLHLKFEHNPKL
jgi:tRNA(Ile)-lysidine synthase